MRWHAYRKLEAERDEVVEELKEYPALAKRLAQIVERLSKNDQAIEQINNHALPSRASKLRSAELIARDLQSFSPGPFVSIPRISQETRLVRFEHDKDMPHLWPPAHPPVDPMIYDFPKTTPPPPVIEKPKPRQPFAAPSVAPIINGGNPALIIEEQNHA